MENYDFRQKGVLTIGTIIAPKDSNNSRFGGIIIGVFHNGRYNESDGRKCLDHFYGKYQVSFHIKK